MGRTKFTLQTKAVQKFLDSLMSEKDRKHLLPALELIIQKVDGYTFSFQKSAATLYFTSGRRQDNQGEPFYSVFVTLEPNASGSYAVSLNVYSHVDNDGCAIQWNDPRGSGWSVSYPSSPMGETRRFRALQERMHVLHSNREMRLGSDLAGQLMDCMLRAAVR